MFKKICSLIVCFTIFLCSSSNAVKYYGYQSSPYPYAAGHGNKTLFVTDTDEWKIIWVSGTMCTKRTVTKSGVSQTKRYHLKTCIVRSRQTPIEFELIYVDPNCSKLIYDQNFPNQGPQAYLHLFLQMYNAYSGCDEEMIHLTHTDHGTEKGENYFLKRGYTHCGQINNGRYMLCKIQLMWNVFQHNNPQATYIMVIKYRDDSQAETLEYLGDQVKTLILSHLLPDFVPLNYEP